ncbi:MAG: TRAP transporter small permease [Betaproteobacteria bacterium]|nr:TRAP transporter small permease [Betaproteobacteria bacterium]
MKLPPLADAPVFRRAGRLLDALLYASVVAAVAILVALVCVVTFEVVMRYAFNRPTRWVVEFSEYALLYLAFLGGAWVLKEEGHVKVELLIEILSSHVRETLHVITSLAGAGVCGLFCWVSSTYIWEIYGTGEILFKAVLVKKWLIMVIIPPGLLLLTLQFVRRAFTMPTRSAGLAA